MAPIIKLEWLDVSIYLLTSALVVPYTCLPTVLIKVSLPLTIVDHLCVCTHVRACIIMIVFFFLSWLSRSWSHHGKHIMSSTRWSTLMRQVPFYSRSLAFALLTDPKDLTVAASFLSYVWETLCNLIVEIHFCLNQDSIFFGTGLLYFILAYTFLLKLWITQSFWPPGPV